MAEAREVLASQRFDEGNPREGEVVGSNSEAPEASPRRRVAVLLLRFMFVVVVATIGLSLGFQAPGCSGR